MVDSVNFDRTPYNVTYFKDGEKHTIRRRPPPLLHEMLPKDEVRLSRGKNEDFQLGDKFTVKHINPKHPNVLQIQDDEGRATFVDYYDLELEKKVSRQDGAGSVEAIDQNQYLLWP